MKQFSEKTIDFLRGLLIAGIVALFILAFMACKTSPEIQGDAPIVVETQASSDVIVEPPVTEPEPVPAIVFENGGDQMIITGFAWRQVYHLWLTNLNDHRAFQAWFSWQVYNNGVFIASAECCLFDIGPGETKLVDVVMVPLSAGWPGDACVLAVRVY